MIPERSSTTATVTTSTLLMGASVCDRACRSSEPAYIDAWHVDGPDRRARGTAHDRAADLLDRLPSLSQPRACAPVRRAARPAGRSLGPAGTTGRISPRRSRPCAAGTTSLPCLLYTSDA